MKQHLTTKIITDNLAALHTAREASVSCEHSEKIWCALSNNTKTSPDTKYVSGDCVYSKRANDKPLKGPGKVLGPDEHQVLVKYGTN